jgi:hypothetical protein
MVTLDRILVSTKWETRFPLSFARSKTRVVSDHWPIFLDSGEAQERGQMHFYFEKQWLMESGCVDMIAETW